MNVARSRRGWLLGAAVALTIQLLVMAAPTYPMRWGTEPDASGTPTFLTTYHSWLAPIVLGYGGFHAWPTFLVTGAAAASAWSGYFGKKTRPTPAWLALAGAALLLPWSSYLGNIGPSHIVIVCCLVAGSAATLYASRKALPTTAF